MDSIYLQCETVTWLYNKSNRSLDTLDIISFKVFSCRLEKELNSLYDKLLELINSSLFQELEINLQEEMWELFIEVGKELEYP